jgi:enterochelin esterase-like enzyme
MKSADSKIFTGLDKTLLPANQKAFTREVAVYVPKQYVDGKAAPILVVQDGTSADVRTDLMNSLDNLIAATDVAKRVPAMIVIFVANGGGDSKGSERGLEYDTVSDRYARFVQTEVLPAVKADAAIKAAYPKLAFTDDPEGRGMYGCSSGGEAAFTAGWFKPEWFRRIVTYSGTFVDLQDDDAAEEKTYPLGSWEYHSKLIPAAEKKPLRVFLAVGEKDNRYDQPESTHFNWVIANQKMAAALKAKGYHYRYVFATGAGHCDAKVRKATLPETLRWMWRGYPLQ